MKLSCKINLKSLESSVLECGFCRICHPKSKLVYPFEKDLKSSEQLVEELRELIETETPYTCEDEISEKNPDIRVLNDYKRLICRVEAKLLEGKAFMKVGEILRDHLKPKETLVIDEPKLKSYFGCRANDLATLGDIPIYVVWKFDRPCTDVGGICVYQNINRLHDIYKQKGDARRYKRRIGKGDIVRGVEMGIRDKYHFSITECEPIEKLTEEIRSLQKVR